MHITATIIACILSTQIVIMKIFFCIFASHWILFPPNKDSMCIASSIHAFQYFLENLERSSMFWCTIWVFASSTPKKNRMNAIKSLKFSVDIIFLFFFFFSYPFYCEQFELNTFRKVNVHILSSTDVRL